MRRVISLQLLAVVPCLLLVLQLAAATIAEHFLVQFICRACIDVLGEQPAALLWDVVGLPRFGHIFFIVLGLY